MRDSSPRARLPIWTGTAIKLPFYPIFHSQIPQIYIRRKQQKYFHFYFGGIILIIKMYPHWCVSMYWTCWIQDLLMFCVSQIWWECIIKHASIDYIPRVQGSVFFMNIPDLSYNLSFQFLWHLKLNFSAISQVLKNLFSGIWLRAEFLTTS